MWESRCLGGHPGRVEVSASRYVVWCGLALALLVVADPVLAVGVDAFNDSKLGMALSNLVSTLNGTIARSLAVIAVIGMGIAALTGRVEWSRAIVVVLGVGIIFSAATLIDALFGFDAGN